MDFIDRYLDELELVVRRLSRPAVGQVVDALLENWRERRMVFLIGNGGSAATASHMMNDLNKCTIVEGMPRFRALALTDNVPLLTALGNDLAYEDIFVEQLKNLLHPKDTVIAMSASGNSPNIVKAVEYARTIGARVIGFCGQPGGRLAQLADLKVVIPSDRIGHQEDGHLILNHVIAAALAERIQEQSVEMEIQIEGDCFLVR
jgi:D-sedoheptulose 7-phosphate isomerase